MKSSLLCHGGGVDQNVCWPSPCWGPSQGGSTCFVTFSQPKTFNKIYVWRCDHFEGDTNNTITFSLSVGIYRFIWNINSWICLSIYNDIFIMLMITCSDNIFEVNEVIDFNQIWTWLFCRDSIAGYSKWSRVGTAILKHNFQVHRVYFVISSKAIILLYMFALTELIRPLIYMAKRKINCKTGASKANEYSNLNRNKLPKMDNRAEIQKNDYERLSKD